MKLPVTCLFMVLCLAVSCSKAWSDPAVQYKTGSAVINSPFVAKPENLTQAVQTYKDHKYADALGQLQKFHDAADFNSPALRNLHDQTHYFMGLSYENMNQVNAAQQQFAWVYSNSKDAGLRRNSQIAFHQLNYYQTHRRYEGQGNVFARDSTPSHLGVAVSSRPHEEDPDSIPDFFKSTFRRT